MESPPAPGHPALELPALSPEPHPHLYTAACTGDAAHLRHLRDVEGAYLFASDGELAPLACAARVGAREALGVFLEAAPPQEQLDDGLACAIEGGHPPCAEALLAAGASPLGVFVLERAVEAARLTGSPLFLRVCLAALAARGRGAVEAALRGGSLFAFSHAVAAAARSDALGPLAALLEFGRWAAGGGAPPGWLRWAASRALNRAVEPGGGERAPVARLLARGGADLGAALARLAPFPPQALEVRQARVREAWAAAEPPLWSAGQEAALDAAVAPFLQELGGLPPGPP